MPKVIDLIRDRVESDLPKTDFNRLQHWEIRQHYDPYGLAIRWTSLNDEIRGLPTSTGELISRTRKEGD